MSRDIVSTEFKMNPVHKQYNYISFISLFKNIVTKRLISDRFPVHIFLINLFGMVTEYTYKYIYMKIHIVRKKLQ